MIYLFLGQDVSSKDIKLKAIKQEFLAKDYHQFNCDTLDARELVLPVLQEKMLTLPFKSPQRIIIIKNAAALKDNIKEYLIKYAKKPLAHLILVLDADSEDNKNEFIKGILGLCRVCWFRTYPKADTFVLGRCIQAKKAEAALKLLNQLLDNGEKPERILGGLRYTWEKEQSVESKRRLKSLLDCDIDIKTGRLKPEFALEKLVIRLCVGSRRL